MLQNGNKNRIISYNNNSNNLRTLNKSQDKYRPQATNIIQDKNRDQIFNKSQDKKGPGMINIYQDKRKSQIIHKSQDINKFQDITKKENPPQIQATQNKGQIIPKLTKPKIEKDPQTQSSKELNKILLKSPSSSNLNLNNNLKNKLPKLSVKDFE